MTPNENITVLLVEDEATLAFIIKDTLDQQGFTIYIAHDGEEGLRMYHTLHPDILVADVMMPRMDGFDMVKRLRQNDPHIPVLFLTARTATEDVVHGFELGANDYLRKPFGMQELMIRLKALVGRACITQSPVPKDAQHLFVVGNYQLNTLTQQLLFSDADFTPQVFSLSHREAEILKRLCLHRGDVVPIRDILLELWGDDSFFNTRSLHVFITKLRHKLSRDPDIRIINVRGIGYKLISKD
ncbi:MAG: response regulator transcription factor [Bacteroidaceae bacterium]|nr:response regulator transcription factor [Bacteroidaceae bacterium]